MTTRVTFSLAEVAADYLPDEWTDSVRWLARRLNRGEISGYRVGRVWRMRDSDIEAMLDKFSNTVVAEPVSAPLAEPEADVSFTDGLSERSRRRLRNVS